MTEKDPIPPTISEQIAWAEQRHRHAIHMYGGKDPTSLMWAEVLKTLTSHQKVPEAA